MLGRRSYVTLKCEKHATTLLRYMFGSVYQSHSYQSHLTFYIIQRMGCDFFPQVFGNKIRPFNIHKNENEVICIFELHWKEQLLRFILVSILMFYDEQDLSYKQFTA